MKRLNWLIFFLSVNFLFSQNEYNNWYFGYNAGISFNTKSGDPIAIDSSLIYTLEGSSAISDTSGNMLFYTDGTLLWDHFHKEILKDTLLAGHTSSTQSSLIINKPASNNTFYIFNADAGEYYNETDSTKHINRGLNYSILEVMNNSIQIRKLNLPIIKPVSEKLTAVEHSNGLDIWVIAHGFNNNTFYKILLSINGINSIQSQSIGTVIGPNWEKSIGYMKVSPNGRYLAYVSEGNDYIEIFEFDNKTGELSNPLIIPTPGRYFNYSLEFSSNAHYLFVSEYKNKTIHRFNISIYDEMLIRKSEELILTDEESPFIGALQIGPNSKIYFTRFKNKYLGSIENPDSTNCLPILNSVYLGNETDGYCSYGLPNMLQSKFKFQAKIMDTVVCENTELLITPVINAKFDDMKFQWKSRTGIVSDNFELYFENIKKSDEGIYYFTAKYRDYLIFDSIFIKVNTLPIAEIEGQNYICGANPIILKSKYTNDDYFYKWNNGTESPEIEVVESGLYILQVSNHSLCTTFDTIQVKGALINGGFDKNEVVMDNICLEENNIIPICYRNYGNKEIIINDIKIKNHSDEISIYNSVSNLVLLGGDSVCFDLSVFSQIPASKTDTLILTVSNNECEMDFFLPIKSTFTLNTTIIIDDYNATPNERLCITLPILTNCKISTDFSDLITAQITYDNEYILIDSINGAKIITDKIIDGRRILNILSDEIKFSNFNNSFSICGTVLVGGSHKTPIEIDSVKWQNPLIKTETSNGSLTINSCVINLRPIKLYNPTSINVTQINENQVKILTKSEITGLHEIYVYNLKNQLLDKYSYYRNPNSPFIEDKLLPINLYPNGSYYFLLKNSKEFKYFNLIILK